MEKAKIIKNGHLNLGQIIVDNTDNKSLDKMIGSTKMADDEIRKFFIWAVDEAQINIIDTVKDIEVHGFKKDRLEDYKIMTLNQLISLYRKQQSKSKKTKR